MLFRSSTASKGGVLDWVYKGDTVPEFERATGHTVKIDFQNISKTRTRINNGDAFDIAVVRPISLMHIGTELVRVVNDEDQEDWKLAPASDARITHAIVEATPVPVDRITIVFSTPGIGASSFIIAPDAAVFALERIDTPNGAKVAAVVSAVEVTTRKSSGPTRNSIFRAACWVPDWAEDMG